MRAPLTPLKAFVHDAEKLGAGGSASSDDAQLSHWFSVAQAAERLAALAPHDRPAYLKILGDAVLPKRTVRPTQIEGDGRAPSDALGLLAERLRVEAEDMERASCFELALTTVSAVCQLLAKHSTSGRLLATAHLGRVNRQMGDLDSAVDCYETVTEDAGEEGDGPVGAHGFIGLGNVAITRGNHPAHKLFFEQALRLAAIGSSTELSARQGLLLAANALRQWADALLHGWRAHDLAPPGSEVQLEILSNLASTALESGFFRAAYSGHEFVISRSTLTRLRLPSIGGAIRAAARIGQTNDVARLEGLGRACILTDNQPFEASRFFLWAAESWHFLGDERRTAPLIDDARKLANLYGFHEIEIRAERLFTHNASLNVPSLEPAIKGSYQLTKNDPIVCEGIERLEALALR